MNNKIQISEEKLREILEENINLKLENSELKRQLISPGIEQLPDKKQKLKNTINNLKRENIKIKRENSELKRDNNQLRYENTELRNEKRKTNNLKDELYTLAYAITTRKNKINETETIKSYISKLFKKLDYDYTSTTFKSEYQLTHDNKNRVDLFYNESKNKNFIVECKKLNTDFNSVRGGENNGETPTEQIRRYLKNTNETNIGILTDGLRIQIHLKNLYTDELFNKYYDINLSHLEEEELQMLEDLSRRNFNVRNFLNKYGQ